MRYVAGAGHGDAHPFKTETMTFKHRFGEVDQAIARRLRTNQAAAEGKPFAGEDAGAVIGKLAHHSRHKAHFAPAHADIPGRHVGIRP
ncbi:Uncharacterised protein [Salmonella enterica subsp. enterica serovar Bovismorbificans]|uniref:Uncharacterized protein n=1 Tax=Salmonella enterica subsp. enterica serovar Bovismorbificans TaxID=58097 RepID=A0A655BNR0_SALET|nr:Uncharacterised protein [Salmonella enterica subsp. enterica serovar Bovismorbificans]